MALPPCFARRRTGHRLRYCNAGAFATFYVSVVGLQLFIGDRAGATNTTTLFTPPQNIWLVLMTEHGKLARWEPTRGGTDGHQAALAQRICRMPRVSCASFDLFYGYHRCSAQKNARTRHISDGRRSTQNIPILVRSPNVLRTDDAKNCSFLVSA